MAVEEVGGLKEQGVGWQLGVGTVEAVGLVKEGEHLLTLLAVAGAKQQGDGKSQPAEDGMDGASHRMSVIQSGYKVSTII